MPELTRRRSDQQPKYWRRVGRKEPTGWRSGGARLALSLDIPLRGTQTRRTPVPGSVSTLRLGQAIPCCLRGVRPPFGQLTRKSDAGCLGPRHSRGQCVDGNASQVFGVLS
jgi:hypothetical protein